MGPKVSQVIAHREDRLDENLMRDVLYDLAACVAFHRRVLERKEPRLAGALLLTLLSVFVALAGQIH